MRAVVIYESMYGNTHAVASAIVEGLGSADDVTVVTVDDVDAESLAAADLIVVGGPTHAHSMSRASTRESAATAAAKPDSGLSMEPDAEGPGLREWFDQLQPAPAHARAAAFDTRIDMPAALTGRASKGIARRLRKHGFDLVADPESFLVTKESHLEPGEQERARAWGATLADQLATA